MKKEIVNIIIIFCLCIMFLINVVQALTLYVVMDETIINNEVIINVKINDLKIDENLINALSAKIEFDKEVLNLESIIGKNDWTSSYSEENGKITLIKLNGTNRNENIFEMKFKVLNNQKLDKTKIFLNNIIVSDGDKEINVSSASVELITEVLNNNTNTVNSTNTNKINNTNTNKVNNTNTNKVNSTNTNKVNNTNINKSNKVYNINDNRYEKVNISYNSSKLENKQAENKTILGNIPYTGGKTYIRVIILILLVIMSIIYIKYKKIDKYFK